MSKSLQTLIITMVCGSILLIACGSVPGTSYPNTDQIDGSPSVELTGELEEAQAVQCFVPRELLPVAFSTDNSQIIVRASHGIQFIDLASGAETAFYPAPQSVVAAALSPDGQNIAWALGDNTIQIIRVSDGTARYTLTGHPDPVLDLRFAPYGDELFSASHDGLVRIWNTQTGLLQGTIEVGLEVVGIGISGDGSLLATVPSDGPIQLWNLPEGSLAASLGGTGGFDTSDPVFSPDGAYLAADLATGLMVWNIDDGQPLWDQPINSMAADFSPDGRWFASSDIDQGNQIILTPADFQGPERMLGQLQGPVWVLFFSANGSLLVVSDGIEIRVWDVVDGSIITVGRSSCP